MMMMMTNVCVCEQLARSPLYDVERLLDESTTSRSRAKRFPLTVALSLGLPGTSTLQGFEQVFQH